MRVLLLSSTEHRSGSALRFRGLAGALARAGVDTHLVEPADPDDALDTPAGVRRHPCPRLPGPPETQAPLWLGHGLAAVRRVRPDVVWSLKALPNSWWPARAAGRAGARVAVDLDDLDHAYYPPGPRRQLLERSFRAAAVRADDVTVHTGAMARRVAALRGDGRPTIFVDQGVEIERFRDVREPPGLRESLGLGEGPVLLWAGHLGPAANLGPLFPVLAPLARERPGLRLLVVGDGRDRARLEAMAEATAPGLVVFAGAVDHREVAGRYALADVALNWLADDEANAHRASIKLREALAAGLPVVASRTEDAERFADWVRFPAGPRPAEFADAVRAELAAPDRARAARGRAWIEAHGTHDAAVRPLLAAWGVAAPGETGS